MAQPEQISPLNNYTVVNESDPNDTFEVEASDYHDALQEALTCLGWFVAVREADSTE